MPFLFVSCQVCFGHCDRFLEILAVERQDAAPGKLQGLHRIFVVTGVRETVLASSDADGRNPSFDVLRFLLRPTAHVRQRPRPE